MELWKLPSAYYEIRIEGALGAIWEDWFEGLKVRQEPNREKDTPISILYGPIPDQPALYGVIAKIRDLNLVLLSIQKIEGGARDESK